MRITKKKNPFDRPKGSSSPNELYNKRYLYKGLLKNQIGPPMITVWKHFKRVDQILLSSHSPNRDDLTTKLAHCLGDKSLWKSEIPAQEWVMNLYKSDGLKPVKNFLQQPKISS